MDQTFSQQSSRYFCTCQNEFIPASLLSDHLNLPSNHRISKVDPQTESSKDFQTSILNKIDALVKIQVQLQQSSFNITQAIIINTTFAMSKLDRLIKLYRDILSNPPQTLEMQDTEIVSTLNVHSSFNQAMISHFEQKIIAQRLTSNRKIEIIKSKILELFTKKSSIYWSIALFNSENFIVTGGVDGFIRVWDAKNYSQCHILKKHASCVFSLAIDLEDKIMLSGSMDCSVRLWDLNSMKHLHHFKGHTNYVMSVVILKNSIIGISGSSDNCFKVWNLKKKEIKSTFSVGFKVTQLFLFNNDKNLAVAGSGGLYFWTFEKNVKKMISKKTITAIAFSKDDQFFIIGNNKGCIQIWVLESFKMIFEDKKQDERIFRVDFSYNLLNFAASSEDKKMIIWDFSSKRVLQSLSFNNFVWDFKYFKDSDTLAIPDNVSVIFFKLKTNLREQRIIKKKLDYQAITISSNLQYMAYRTSKLVLFDLEKGTQISNRSFENSPCCFLKFTPDSDYLSLGFTFGEVHILKVSCLTQVSKFSMCRSKVRFLAFSTDSKFLASAFEENILIVFSTENKKVVYRETNIEVVSIAFCLNNERLVYSIENSIIVIDKNFKKIATLKIENDANFLFVKESNGTLLVTDYKSNWSVIDTATPKILFDKLTKIDLKNSRAKDPKLDLFMHNPKINFS